MNINLIYEGKDYNFDIPNGVTIDYLKELSSRIFNSDKALLDLVYNNQKIENKDDNALIRDLIPEGETNTILTVQINKDTNNSTKDEIVPLVSLKTKTFNNNDNNKESNNNDDNKEQSKNNKEKDKMNKKDSKKKINNKSLDKDILHNMNNNKNHRSKLIIDTNKNINVIKKDFDIKSFQSNFLRKNKELLELIKEFNNKVKEVYLSLYKKYKNVGGNNNNISSFSNNSSISSISTGLNNNYFYELSIYEKKIMNFEENQINYYRTLLELIDKYEKKKDILQLNNFYAYLIINNNNISKNSNKNIDPIKYLKFKKLLNNKLLINDSLRNNNLSTLNINNNNHLPLLKNRSINSSLNLEKKNIYFNNMSGINSYQNKNQINNIKNKQVIDEMKEKNQIVNNISKSLKTSKMKKGSLLIENKSIINNNTKSNILNDNNNENNNNEKNNNNANNLGENNNNNNSNTNNSNTNSSLNIDELSEKDLVNDIDINKNSKNKISPIPLQIRNSLTTNILPRKFSMINNNMIRNRNNSIFSNHLNSGLESIDRGNEEKAKQKYTRFSSLNFQNKLNSPKKRITINDYNSPNKSKRKGLNDSMNENGLVNAKKIKEIDVSSMTVNDSNFIRDKQKGLKMKNNKDMNKYDFFM